MMVIVGTCAWNDGDALLLNGYIMFMHPKQYLTMILNIHQLTLVQYM